MVLRVVALALLVSSAATADTLRATRAQPLSEIAHTVDVTVAEGVATYTVRRVFMNPGEVAEQVEMEIDLPYGAAATGLRIRAADRWYAGVLLERETATRLYQEMTGFGDAQAKDPALLAWMWADKLSLQVFPVMPRGVATVEYTLTAPTRFERGRYHVAYPRVAQPAMPTDELPLATPVLRVHAAGDVFVDGERVKRDTAVLLAPRPEPAWADALTKDARASYVSSVIEVPSTRRTQASFAKATVSLDIAHTYRSDLRVELITPGGDAIALHERAGSGDNAVRGKHVAELPGAMPAAGTWRLVVSDHAARDTGSIDRWSITFGAATFAASDTPIFVPDAPEPAGEAGLATISVAAGPIEMWQARFGRVVASTRHVFGRLELDVAPQLVALPAKAQVVFAIDTSHSQHAAGLETQLAIVRAYLTHVPDAEVELVTYQRVARRVFGGFVPARAIEHHLDVASRRGAFTLGNGSALDAGAEVAVAALATRTGPRRLVLMTDELLRSTLLPAHASATLATLSPETIVHVVVPRVGSEIALHRRDDATLASLATSHHGIYVDFETVEASPIKAHAPVALELVRPTRIEHLTATGFELDRDVLQEGDGLRVMIDEPTLPAYVELRGFLWSDPVTKRVTVDPTFSTKTAAFVFGEDQHGELAEDEMMRVAVMGRAVSPVTSYLAAEPGVRPSTIGLGWGTIGSGRYGTIGHGSGTGSGYVIDEPDLADLLDTSTCVDRLRPSARWTVTLAIERTGHEIVDVIARTPGPIVPCLVETAWALQLPSDAFPSGRKTYVVTLRGDAVSP